MKFFKSTKGKGKQAIIITTANITETVMATSTKVEVWNWVSLGTSIDLNT